MTGARPDTWMPLYWGDYRRDTAHLSAAEHGAYLLLLGHYWTSGKPLPDDDRQLARVACMSPAEWKKARPIIAGFFTIADAAWTHGRVEKELKKASERYAKRAGAANRRWSKAQSEGDAMHDPKQDAMHEQPQPHSFSEKKKARARRAILNGNGEGSGVLLGEADVVERKRATAIADGMYLASVAETQIRLWVERGWLTAEQAQKAGYAA